jgi:hypothetical protein
MRLACLVSPRSVAVVKLPEYMESSAKVRQVTLSSWPLNSSTQRSGFTL